MFRNLFLPRFDAAADAGAATTPDNDQGLGDLAGAGENPFDGGASFDDMMAQLDAAEGGSVFDRMHREAQAGEGEQANDDEADGQAVADAQEQADVTAEGEAAQEAKAEGAEGEEQKAEQAKAEIDFSAIEQLLPGAVIESMEDLQEHITRYRESHDVMQRFEALIENNEPLQKYIAALVDKKDPRIAAVEAFGEFAKRPDPDEEPEAYAEWLAEQKAAAVRAEFEKKERTAQETRIRGIAQQASQVFDATVKRLNLSEDDAKSIAHLFQSLTQGDPVTGRFRSDAFEVLHNGRQFASVQAGLQDAVEKAKSGDLKNLAAEASDHPLVKTVKAALREAFIAGGKQAGKAKSEIPQAPDLAGSRGSDSPEQNELRTFARSLQGEKPWWDAVSSAN